jgi:hypothetical protein
MPDNSALLIWEKIQPVPTSTDLDEALRGEVHDPLWLLARQWQLGEFKAEDAGMAAYAHVVTISTPIQRFAGAGAPTAPVAYQLQEQPLNALVEQLRPAFDLTLRMEAGRRWRNMLVAAGKAQAWEVFRQNPLLQFKMPALTYASITTDQVAQSYEPYEQMLAAVGNSRMVDGAALYQELKNHQASDFLPQPDPVVNETATRWIGWVNEHLKMEVSPDKTSWDASRLEYRATTAALQADGTAVSLQLPEHNGQLMDSFSWEQTSAPGALNQGLDPARIVVHRNTFIPTPVTFPAMPRARWWEFEDSTIDLGNLQARKTDLGLLLLAEFGLIYSNDWLLTPLTLPAGHLARVRSLRVTDVFGVQSNIPAATQNNNWELFQLTTPAAPQPRGWLYLPPVAHHYLESAPVEEIRFLRDEMANVVWGVEMTIPSGLGEGIEGRGAALRLEEWLAQLAGKAAPAGSPALPDIGAPFRYSIGSTVPPHWIPFIPLRPAANSAQIVFRRAAMPRFLESFAPTRIRPRTTILGSTTGNQKHYDIQEEEIPASGISLRQVWRRARWFDGRTITWLAREKSIGRYTDSSGLQFDQLE